MTRSSFSASSGASRPELAGCRQKLLDLFRLRRMAVTLARGVRGEPEGADGVALAQPEHRYRHGDVLVDAREGQGLDER